MSTIIKIYENKPAQESIDKVVSCLQDGGVVIYPTDTIYGIGCSIDNARSVERIIQLKGLNAKRAQFSFICSDISQIAEFAKINNQNFKILRDNLPGPFTFILPGLSRVPAYFISKRKTVGVRIPANSIPRKLVEGLGIPILTTSLPCDTDPNYTCNPELMQERWGDQVDMIIDGGEGGLEASTVVDCTGDEPEIVRSGKGDLIL